jgi:hypothetical protein
MKALELPLEEVESSGPPESQRIGRCCSESLIVTIQNHHGGRRDSRRRCRPFPYGITRSVASTGP